MTRINVVSPQELCDQHLLAEYRELPRVFNLAHRAKKIPAFYTFGTGHVTFFYDKLLFLLDRQRSIIEEMKHRGFELAYLLTPCLPYALCGTWAPNEAAIALNRERLYNRRPARVRWTNRTEPWYMK